MYTSMNHLIDMQELHASRNVIDQRQSSRPIDRPLGIVQEIIQRSERHELQHHAKWLEYQALQPEDVLVLQVSR